MGEKRGTAALEEWCRQITTGYMGVEIRNMTTSWRNGLAFCALIHRFRPDLIDFDSLRPGDVLRNNELAFTIASRHLGIPQLLDQQDMLDHPVPDRLSILTYVAQYYKAFQHLTPKKIPSKRRSDVVDSDEPPTRLSPSPTPPDGKSMSKVGGMLGGREPCSFCRLPVFLAERLVISGRLFHRGCFQCARCHTQLHLANYYETEDGLYCCETCPDEEHKSVLSSEENNTVLRNRDNTDDEYSATFESVLEDNQGKDSSFEVNSDLSINTKTRVNSALVQTRLQWFENIIGSRNGDNNIGLEHDDIDSGVKREEDESILENKLILSAICVPISEDIVPEVPESVSEVPESKTVSEDIVTESKLIAEGEDPNSVSELPEPKMISEEMVPKTEIVTEDNVSEASGSILDSESVMRIETPPLEGTVSTLKDDAPFIIEKSHIIEEKATETTTDNVPESETISEEFIPKSSSVISGDVNITDFSKDSERIEIGAVSPIPNEADLSIPEIVITLERSESSEQLVPNENVQVPSIEIPELEQDNSTKELEEEHKIIPPKVTPRKKIPVVEPEIAVNYPGELNPFGDSDGEETAKEDQKLDNSSNPFGSFDEKVKPQQTEEDRTSTPNQNGTTRTNPFWSDDDEEEEDSHPQPGARAMITPSPPKPKPRHNLSSVLIRRDSSSSLSSVGSSASAVTRRKKRPAPQPPSRAESLNVTPTSSVNVTPSKPVNRTLSRSRKSRPAPPPPPLAMRQTQTPQQQIQEDESNEKQQDPPKEEATKEGSTKEEDTSTDGTLSPTIDSQLIQDKNQKELQNRSMQINCTLAQDKSEHGQWKRKKGPAPSRPLPRKRKIEQLPVSSIQCELKDMEVKHTELERQGVGLEKSIRSIYEGDDNTVDNALDPEELILQLFEVVNVKNELFRRETELMYLKRQHRLEVEHAELEYEIRCLLERSENSKTDEDRKREEELITRLVQVVELRNEVVEGLERERQREVREDCSVQTSLREGMTDDVSKEAGSHKKKAREKGHHHTMDGLKTLKLKLSKHHKDSKDGKDKEDSTSSAIKKKKTKESKKKKKEEIVDADKDIDETEQKEKKSKKKWSPLKK